MGIFSDLFGGTKETRSDGSVTERFSTGSITTDSDGTVREATSQQTTHPLGFGEKITVTGNPSHSDSNRMFFLKLVHTDGTELVRGGQRLKDIEEDRKQRALLRDKK